VKTHVVTKGETLSSIARQELGTTTRWKDLARWNGIADPATLKEGTPLRLGPADGSTVEPPTAPNERSTARSETEPRTHRIAKGDTLSRIAARYLGDATRWREIQRLNAIADPASLAEGATLKIPER
jgi:nucleoid-associated protein YgaU